MKNLIFTSILVLTFCICSFAQTNITSPCPSISVIQPDTISKPNEPQIFTVSMSEDAKNYKIEYKWSVSIGEIIEGQGTPTIKVLQEDVGKILTATVELIGLPERCAATESGTAPICQCDIAPILLEEFSKPVPRIDNAILDAFLIELQNDPTAKGYIIEKFQRNTSRKLIKQKVQKINNYLFEIKKIEKDRIVILTKFGDENLTRLYRVPAGAQPPTVDEQYKSYS